MASYGLNSELGDFTEESSEFNLELIDFGEYTPISEIEPISFYNIIGVLADFDGNTKIDQEYKFKLMDSSGCVKINYYQDYNQINHPSFSQEYQVIIIRNIIFTVDKKGSLIGLLNQNSWYKILTSNDIKKSSEITKLVSEAKEVHKPSSLISSENIESHQTVKRVKYTENIEHVQHTTTLTSQNQDVLEDDPIISSKDALNEISCSSSNSLLNSLADAQPYNTYQIIAQVLKLEQAHPNRNQYIISDYSSSDKFRSTTIKLPNSKTLSGKYFVNLTAWDDQKDSIEVFKFYKFSIVKVKLDKMGNIELVINGTKSTIKSNVVFPLLINQMECSVIKGRMDIVLGSDKNKLTQSSSSEETIKEPKFRLVKELKIGESYDMLLLVLKRVYSNISGKLTLLCTDFTPNPMLRYDLFTDYNGVALESSMLIHVVLNDNTESIIKNIILNNQSREIYQFLGLKVEVSSIYGIELVLNSNSATKLINNCIILTFDPVPKTDSTYYKELIKKRNDHSNQSTLPLPPVIPAIRPMTEQKSQARNSHKQAKSSNIWENAVIISDSEESDAQHTPKRVKEAGSINSLIIISDDEEEV